jgi:hypothetical protein
MGEQITTAKHLLETVTKIREKYDEIAKLTGENFNLLRILGKEHYENYHSAIISDLLNEKGSHGQDDLFLKLFVDMIKVRIKNDNEKRNLFNEINHFSNSKAQTEKPTSDGRIDVFISDSSQILIVENKIGASHQPEQLRRYYLDVKSKYKNRNYLLLFLWKFEVDFNDKEFNETFGEGDDKNEIKNKTISISYKEDIKAWIEKCIKESANLPIIRETLNQYLNTINEITDQSTNKKMSMEIFKILNTNLDYLESAKQIKITFDSVCKLKRDEFISNLMSELNQVKLLPPESLKDFDFVYEFVEDYSGFCFCLYVKKNEKRCDYRVETLLSNFKSQFYLNNTNKKYLGDNNPIWFAWINPNKENPGKFNTYSVREMFDLSVSEGSFKTIVENCKELIKDFNKTAVNFTA